MLTFSEALVLLKAGEDLRYNSWPRGHFVRAFAIQGGAELRKFTRPQWALYTPTQPELFGQNWSKA